MDCKNFSTKNKYSILKYISSLLVLDNQKTLLHGYNFINKRNKTQKYFLSKNEAPYDDVPTKRKVGM